jgi:predicted membrane protein
VPAISSELISGVVAFLLTIFVLSYLIGDQFLFRAAIYIFVGVSAGYVATVVWYQVLTPQLIQPLLFGSGGERTLAIFPFFLTILLFAKAVPALSKLGTPSVAFMVGVGAAVAIGGAVTGTIFPQTGAAIDEVGRNSFEGVLMLFGTISTLIYFQFSAKRGDDGEYRRNLLTRIFSFIGKVFIAITFGVLFAGVYSAALTAFIERLDFLSSFITSLKTLWLP